MTIITTDTVSQGKEASRKDGWLDEWMVPLSFSPTLSGSEIRPPRLRPAASEDRFQPARPVRPESRLLFEGGRGARSKRGERNVQSIFFIPLNCE
jgi:hypothetical protein